MLRLEPKQKKQESKPPESAVGKLVMICVSGSLIAVMNTSTRIQNSVEGIEGKPRKVMVH